MRIHADLSRFAEQNAQQLDWVPSPLKGVDRRMLDRDGEEVARATSIVRYEPGSSFSPHIHTGGEEYYVLAGTFSDESGDYPAGTYVRNPVGSRHQPFTKSGCQIWVKLQQMDPDDQDYVVINTVTANDTLMDGVPTLPLHKFKSEQVLLRSLAQDINYQETSNYGLEVLVLDGKIEINDNSSKETRSAGSLHWLRWPGQQQISITSRAPNTRLLIKRDHLPVV